MRRASPTPGDAPALLWLMPALAMLALFYAVPVLDVLRLAFSDATLIRPATEVSTRAVAAVLSNPALPQVVGTTALFTLASVIALQGVGLAIALLIVRGERRGLRGMTALRTLVLAAWVVPGIANGLIWQILFSEAPYGGLNSLLGSVGLGPVAWLSDPQMALVSAVIANTWQGAAFSMIVFYAALRAIDPVIYEAAEVDGARAFTVLTRITLPLLRGAVLVNSVLVTVQTLNTFDAILALTGGGPGRATEVLALFTFNTVFYNLDLAGGSALAILLFALAMALALVLWVTLGRRDMRA
ncbi:carbohydrate ABC transporter permease [Jannaschia rubra]|uniref:carbohydrate ABC transporter permease n=1 Tax=Jannaschia rubra TaxID=282197 RepID=UPI00249021E2|nr:sugar ABC transporter permease [Jannaschia rubra]